MATVISAQVCLSSDCKTLEFIETTGAYNSLSNTTGWGAPNQTTGDATAATLVATNPAGTSYTINLFSTTYFPTTNTSLEYTIPMTSIGLASGASLTDGIWSFTYTVTTNSTTYTYNWTQAFYCQVQCCVYSMFKDLDVECDCSYDTKQKALDAYLLLKGLIYAGNCGNTTEFASILATLQKICLNSDCQTCN